MKQFGAGVTDRRMVLSGAMAAAGLLVLPGCASVADWTYTDAVRRLMARATTDAFAVLTAPDGFWNSAVARVNLPVLFGESGKVAKGILTSEPFRERLQHQLNRFAEGGAKRAAPVVADAVRTIGIEDAAALISGKPTAATTFLRGRMGPALVNAMIPELEQAMRAAHDPVLGQAISALAGVSIPDAAHALAIEADNAIWFEVGSAEAAIRRDPEATQDPVLIAALGGKRGS